MTDLKRDAEKKLEEIRDNVEKKYVDPLESKIDEYSKGPLAWIKKNGRKAALIFAGAVFALGLLYVLIF